jgi:hypothetical protein
MAIDDAAAMSSEERIFQTPTDVLAEIHYHAWHLARELPLVAQDPAVVAMVTAFIACEAALQAAEESGLASDDEEVTEITAIRNRLATYLGMPVDGVPATFRRAFKDDEGA